MLHRDVKPILLNKKRAAHKAALFFMFHSLLRSWGFVSTGGFAGKPF